MNRVDDAINEVREVIELFCTRPNRRNEPKEGDLQGDYDEWFDGGALKFFTGGSELALNDGRSARYILSSPGCLAISLCSDASAIAIDYRTYYECTVHFGENDEHKFTLPAPVKNAS